MSFLKSLVAVLAFLILLAVGLLGYGLLKQTEDPNWRLFSIPNDLGSANPPNPALIRATKDLSQVEPWGTTNLNLSPDCRISNIKPDGYRLYITIEPIGRCQQIIIINPNTGKILGSVRPRS